MGKGKDSDYYRMIGSRRWQLLRKEVLTMHPTCERCQAEGYVTAATEVHHRRPVEYGINLMEKQRLMFNPGNLMALCHSCHVAIHTEMGRSGKVATRRRVEEQKRGIIEKFFE